MPPWRRLPTPRISIRAVLMGGAVDMIASFVYGLGVAFYVMFTLDRSNVPTNELAGAIAVAIHGNKTLYVAELFVGFGCSALGGYVAATISKRDRLLDAIGSSTGCVVLGIYAIAVGKSYDPLEMKILILVATPAVALCGGRVALWRENRRRIE